jgi:hypothetical protein
MVYSVFMSAKPTQTQNKITVTGWGQFPIDMLRYDRATPASEGDSAAITNSFNRPRGAITVNLLCPRPPTQGRWESFGFRVTSITVVAKP